MRIGKIKKKKVNYSENRDAFESENRDEKYIDKSEEKTDTVEEYVEKETKAKDFSIYCDNLVKIYKSSEIEVMALQGLDLEVEKGEFMAIIGKSGSGKSTLMNLISGLEIPTLGQIYVEGRNLADFSEKEMVKFRKQVIGFVWQKSERNLLKYLTAIDNVVNAMLFTKRSKEEKYNRALELLTMTGIDHKKDSFPHQMSGGEQQRVAIAVALANDPKIILADEPTGAVDSKTSNDIQDLFRELNQKLNITVIIVTHDMNLANKVNRVVMISDGKISTEKIMKEDVRRKMQELEDGERMEIDDNSHEEFSVLDKANRVQLTKEILAEAGIDSRKVVINVKNGEVIISKQKNE